MALFKRLLLVLLITCPAHAAVRGANLDNTYHQSNVLAYHKTKKPSSTLFNIDSGVWYAGVGTGLSVSHVNTNTYGYAPAGSGLPNDQFVSDSSQNEPFISLFGGYRFSSLQEWIPYYSVGLLYSYIFTSQVDGVINQFSNTTFQNYQYEYQIQRQTVLATIKADVYQWEYLLPYVTAGLGFSRNSVYDYSEQAFPGVTPRVSPGFGAKASIYGSWMLGFGADIIFSKEIWGSLEYNYGQYGYAQTANGSENSGVVGANYSNSNLQTQLTASTFAANITYYFE